VRRFPEGNGQQRISTGGGEQPRWRSDGKELFFVSAEGTLTAVAMKSAQPSDSAASVLIEAPMPLFETRIGEGSGHVAFQYDVSADGKRFVVATTPRPESTSLTAVINWTQALRE